MYVETYLRNAISGLSVCRANLLDANRYASAVENILILKLLSAQVALENDIKILLGSHVADKSNAAVTAAIKKTS
jgi:hypothetical protein